MFFNVEYILADNNIKIWSKLEYNKLFLFPLYRNIWFIKSDSFYSEHESSLLSWINFVEVLIYAFSTVCVDVCPWETNTEAKVYTWNLVVEDKFCKLCTLSVSFSISSKHITNLSPNRSVFSVKKVCCSMFHRRKPSFLMLLVLSTKRPQLRQQPTCMMFAVLKDTVLTDPIQFSTTGSRVTHTTMNLNNLNTWAASDENDVAGRSASGTFDDENFLVHFIVEERFGRQLDTKSGVATVLQKSTLRAAPRPHNVPFELF